MAVALLGTSLLFDRFQEQLPFRCGPGQLFEEGVKFLGIALWLFFCWRASAGAAELRSLLLCERTERLLRRQRLWRMPPLKGGCNSRESHLVGSSGMPSTRFGAIKWTACALLSV